MLCDFFKIFNQVPTVLYLDLTFLNRSLESRRAYKQTLLNWRRASDPDNFYSDPDLIQGRGIPGDYDQTSIRLPQSPLG